MIGTTILHYRIVERLGAGGMGEMYQAHDTKLGRDVAIKVLPEAFANDPERLSRFQREAKMLAALNHPNIATIYGLEHSNSTHYLVMELVGGETLADRVKRDGSIPVEEALGIAKQIAEALEAAHEKGIIHRDLKPANVKVTPEGKVKVLDFGLAKAFTGDSAIEEMSNSPTLSMAATTQGVILGTAAYMSPEQARGKVVDKRTDIWAFGAVLYELLTGRQAFHGEDITDILAAVVRAEPDWNKLPENTPQSIRRLLRRCLQKDKTLRMRDAGDVGMEIHEARAAPKDASAAPSALASRGKLPWALAAGATFAALALGALLWRATPPAELKPLVRLDVDLGPDVSLGSAGGTDAILSPDGTRIVYVSQNRLFTRRLDQPKATELAGTEGAFAPFFSPDGQWVGFFGIGRLKKISVEGGATIALSGAINSRGGSWGEDGNIVAALNNVGPLTRIPASGGSPVALTELTQGEVTHRWPQVLPGAKAVLFTAQSTIAAFDSANIEAISLRDRRQKTLVRGGTFGRYLATSKGAGHLVYVSAGTLFAVPFDLDKLETRGTPSPVLDGITYSILDGFAEFDASRNGTLLYRKSGPGGGGLFTVQWLDGTGKTQPLLAKPDAYLFPRLSPDGEKLAVSTNDVWVYDWRRDTLARLTFGGGGMGAPLWSPDGRFIIFRKGGEGMFWIRSDGAGKPQPLTQTKNQQTPYSFTPDGKRLAFHQFASERIELWTVPLESDDTGLRAGKPEIFLQSTFNERSPSFSSDGRWLAYASDESGPYQVYVRAFPDTGGKWQISSSGGVYPVFSRNGRELFFRREDSRTIMVASYSAKGDSFVAEKPRVWSEKRIADIGLYGPNYDVAPDGKRIAALMPADTVQGQQAQNHVIFLENFFDELRRKAPMSSK